MKKIVTIIGAVLMTAATVQIASAGQRDKVRKTDSTQSMQNQQARDSNAYYGARDGRYDGSYDTYRDERRLQSLYEGGAISAPAGR